MNTSFVSHCRLCLCYYFRRALTHMLVLLSSYVMLSILLSILVCAAESLFYVCTHIYIGRWPCCFRRDPVFGVCRPACHDSSLNFFFLVLFLDLLVLPEDYVAFAVLYQHIVHADLGVVDNHHLSSFFDVHLQTVSAPSSGSFCITCCNYSGVPVHRHMSSTKGRLLRNYTSRPHSSSLTLYIILYPV